MSLVVQIGGAASQALQQLAHKKTVSTKDIGEPASGQRSESTFTESAESFVRSAVQARVDQMKDFGRRLNDGISIAQIADGTLKEAGHIMKRMRELAVEAGGESIDSSKKDSIGKEFKHLQAEAQRMFIATTFNGEAILADGARVRQFSLDPAGSSGISSTLTTRNMTTDASIKAITDSTAFIDRTSSASDLKTLIDNIDLASTTVGQESDKMRTAQHSLTSTWVQVETEHSSLSGKLDYNQAKELADMSRAAILTQSGLAVLAQANQAASVAVSLLR